MAATIILCGDSYAAGRLAGTTTDGELARQLRRLAPDNVIEEQAVSGSTASEWARGKYKARLQAISARSDCAAVVSIGGNDVFAALKDGKITMEELAALARDTLSVATMLSMSMPTYVLIYPVPQFLREVKLANIGRKAIALMYHGICAATGATAVDLSAPLGMAQCWQGADVHPNEAGYRAMAHAVMQAIGWEFAQPPEAAATAAPLF